MKFKFEFDMDEWSCEDCPLNFTEMNYMFDVCCYKYTEKRHTNEMVIVDDCEVARVGTPEWCPLKIVKK